MLHFHGSVFFIDGNDFKQAPVGIPVPVSNQWIFDSHIPQLHYDNCAVPHLLYRVIALDVQVEFAGYATGLERGE
jgi:hypothetical protein